MTTGIDDWNAHWDQYAASASRNPAQLMRFDLVKRLLLRNTRGRAATRLFDIGCGQGDLLRIVHAVLPRAELLGAEMSQSGVSISHQKIPNAKLIIADMFKPPPELEAYRRWATDAVCSEVLEHVDDPVAFLKATRPYLADGCKLVLTVPGGPMSAYDRHIGHRRHFSRAQVSSALENAGFEPELTWMSGFPFFNLYRLTVIARGRKLVDDAREEGGGSVLADIAMATFRFLFKFNLANSPFGWQVVAVGHKTGP